MHNALFDTKIDLVARQRHPIAQGMLPYRAHPRNPHGGNPPVHVLNQMKVSPHMDEQAVFLANIVAFPNTYPAYDVYLQSLSLILDDI